MDAERFVALLRAICATRQNEIDCDACYRSLGQFVECILAGRDLSTALKCVDGHLQHNNAPTAEKNSLLSSKQLCIKLVFQCTTGSIDELLVPMPAAGMEAKSAVK